MNNWNMTVSGNAWHCQALLDVASLCQALLNTARHCLTLPGIACLSKHDTSRHVTLPNIACQSKHDDTARQGFSQQHCWLLTEINYVTNVWHWQQSLKILNTVEILLSMSNVSNIINFSDLNLTHSHNFEKNCPYFVDYYSHTSCSDKLLLCIRSQDYLTL